MTALLVLVGCSAEETPRVPAVEGLRLDDAHNVLKDAGYDHFNDQDAVGDRVPWVDSNWAVVRQEPLPNEPLKHDDQVVLHIAKPEDEGIRELLPSSSPVLADIREQDMRKDAESRAAAASSTTESPPPPPPVPAFRYQRDIEEPPMPTIARVGPGTPGTAYLEVAGSWSGAFESASVQCDTFDPLESTFRGWSYRVGPSVAGHPPVEVQLQSEYANGPDEGRLQYNPSVSAAFVNTDDTAEVWTAYAGPTNFTNGRRDPQASVVVSDDRSTVSFSAVALTRPTQSFGVDLDMLGWITITGTVTCLGPLPDVAE